MTDSISRNPIARAGRTKASEVMHRNKRLLDVAEELMLSDGYDGVSLGRIAREAQVAVRTIYATYGGKPGILMALVQREAEQRTEELEMVARIGCVQQRLQQLASCLSKLVTSERRLNLYRCLLVLGDQRRIQAFHESGVGVVIKMIEDQFVSPDFRELYGSELPLGTFCDVFLGYVVGLNLRSPLTQVSMPALFSDRVSPVQANVHSFLKLFDARQRSS